MAKKVAILLGQDFEDSDFKIPYDRLKAEGIEVDIIGREAGEELVGKKGKVRVRATRAIADARPEEYALLVIPGGYAPDKLRADERFVRVVREFDRTRKPPAEGWPGAQPHVH